MRFLPAVPQAAPAQAPSPEEGQVRITARTKELTKNRIFASGDVEVTYKKFRLFADRVEYDPETKDVLAEGNVVIQSNDEVTRAERVRFNLDSGRARLDQAEGMIQPSILYRAETLERQTADRYSLSRASVTACTQPVPRWRFSFTRATLVTGDYIEMWNTVLKVKNIPVFYIPYLRYPLEKDRASGFLMPKIGLSGPKGMMYSQSYYWAIARNMDLTMGLDYYLKSGLGAGLEYRYLFSKGTGGEAKLYYFFFKRYPDGTKPDNAAAFRLSHTQALPWGFSLAADVDYQSSYDFLRDFDNSFRQASVTNRSSQVFLSRSWRKFNLSARASVFETYFADAGDAIRNVSMPQVNFNVFKVRVLSPVFFSLNASFSNWRYGWGADYAAGTERHTTVLLVRPSLSLPITSIPWLTAATSVTANFSYYGQSLNPESGNVEDNPLFTHNYGLSVELTGPVFTRIFYDRRGGPRLKNIIEPYVNYVYESPISQSDRIVTTTGFYRLNQVNYGLTSRFLLRQGDHPAEVLAFGAGQTYYFSPEDGPLARFPVNGRPPRFSEVSAYLRFYPVALYSVDAALGYNPYYRTLSTLRLTATAGSKGVGDFLSLSWFKSLNSWVAGTDPELVQLYNRDQVNVFAGTHLPGLSLDLQGEVDYNIKDRKLLYTAAQAVYNYQCLNFLLEVRVFYFRLPPETQVRFSMGLGNIGRTMDFLGGIGF